MTRYNNRDDVALRLQDTVVRWKGQFYHVCLTPEGMLLAGRLLTNKGRSSNIDLIDPNDLELDIASPLLGYVQDGEQAGYVVRPPHRRQRQGLCSSVLSVLWPHSGGLRDFPWRITDVPVCQMLNNFYMSPTSAFLTTTGDGVSKAFSRNFCFYRENGVTRLMYQGEHVGHVTAKEQEGLVAELLPVWNLNSIMLHELTELGIEVKDA